jgi:dTDP-4-amino-4,6-dideoxygalactose transaminase
MVTPVSRYGPRVIPNTMETISALEKSGELIEGPHIAQFEAAFSERVLGRRAISASYGRMAFFYILEAMQFPAGSEIIFPALTFWVMPEMARQAGLRPVFADVDPVTFNITAAAIERAVTLRTVAVVPTHLWGLPCDMDEIMAVASRHGLAVIEDCAHALGATYDGWPVGTFGHAAIFSFQTFKPLNAYGGGMAVVHDPDVASRVAALASAEPAVSMNRVKHRLWHGRVMRLATRPDVFKWTLFPLMYTCTRLHWSIDMYFWEKIRPLNPTPEDYHERFTNVQAAIALEGLARLDEWTAKRQQHAARMNAMLGDVAGIRVPVVPAGRTHVYYQYCAYVPSRDAVVDACLRRGIDLETLHVDVCPDLELFGRPSGRASAPGALQTTGTVQIPIYESLSEHQLACVAEAVRDAVQALEPQAAAGAAVREPS